MRNYRAFWWMMAVIILAYPGMTYMFHLIFGETVKNKDMVSTMAQMVLGAPFDYPEVWHTVAYASSLLTIAPAIIVIMFITNEYDARTHRQNIIDGWTRSQFMTAKLIDVLILTVITTFMFTITSIVTGYATTGKFSFDGGAYIGWFFLMIFTQLSMAFLMAFLIKKSFIAVGLFMGYGVVIEEMIVKILRFKAHTNIGRFFPFESSDLLVIPPSFLSKMNPEQYKLYESWHPQQVFVSLGYLVLVWALCYWINAKRDLK